jgi:1-deoxy-D-xylulose-5-phosphate reductoisomerase
MKRIALLGCTGSIGGQTLDLIRSAPESYSLIAVAAAGSDLEQLAEIVHEFRPALVAVKSPEAALSLQKSLLTKCTVLHGTEGLKAVAASADASDVVMAVVGAVGLEPTLTALKLGKKVIVANKETLVSAGHLIREALNQFRGSLIPADSEHVALHQCLDAKNPKTVRQAYLTASGGPFYNLDLNFAEVTVQQALKHPTWTMGAKITIDSATLMNKGLEVIEAERLFDLNYDQIKVLVHPESLVHSMVEFIDGNILAQLGPNDMRLALQYALDWPERKENLSGKFLDLAKAGTLQFFEPNFERFPCLQIAYEVGRLGKTYPAVLVAADEVAVDLFLKEQILFSDIPKLIRMTLDAHDPCELKELADVQEADRWARKLTYNIYKTSLR